MRLHRTTAALALLSAILSASGCADRSSRDALDGERARIDGVVIKLHGIDAPESGDRAQCEAERGAAAAARQRLQAILDKAETLEVRRTGMACLSFMTCDGFVAADGVDVSGTLLADGVAKRVVVDPSASPNSWCD